MFRMRQKEKDMLDVIFNARRGQCAWPDNSEPLMNAKLTSLHNQMVDETNRTQCEVDQLQTEIEGIQNEADFSNLVPRSKKERYWLLSSESGQVGFLPATGTHEKVTATKTPTEAEILKVVAWHPSQKSTNVPLSVKNIIIYADKIELNDDSLILKVPA